MFTEISLGMLDKLSNIGLMIAIWLILVWKVSRSSKAITFLIWVRMR